MGLAVGIATLVRWQDVIYLVFPASVVIQNGRNWGFRRTLIYSGLVAAGTIVALFPQLLLWNIHFGTWVTIPQGQGFMHWGNPQVWQVLFSARHGLISWTPLIAFSMAGIVWMSIRKFSIGIPILIVLLLQLYVNSVVSDWWAGWGFGGRRFLDLIPFFILGTAFLIKELPKRIQRLVPVIISILILWNITLLYHYFSGHVNFGGAVYFSDWYRENMQLIKHHPIIVMVGIAVIVLGLIIIHRIFCVKSEVTIGEIKPWQPKWWMVGVTISYLIVWSLHLTYTFIGMETIQVPNPLPNTRDWRPFIYRPPFKGCGLYDVVTPDNPWQQSVNFETNPGGNWKLVTAGTGTLEPGDTAAVIQSVSVDGIEWDCPLIWDKATGPLEISELDLTAAQPTAPISRIDLPPKVRELSYRTFKPLPLYFVEWVKFMRDYSDGNIPLHAAYEYSFSLPVDFTPKQFEIHLKEALECNIYGIGKVIIDQ